MPHRLPSFARPSYAWSDREEPCESINHTEIREIENGFIEIFLHSKSLSFSHWWSRNEFSKGALLTVSWCCQSKSVTSDPAKWTVNFHFRLRQVNFPFFSNRSSNHLFCFAICSFLRPKIKKPILNRKTLLLVLYFQICIHIYIKFKTIHYENVFMDLRWEVFSYLNCWRLNCLFVLKLYCILRACTITFQLTTLMS